MARPAARQRPRHQPLENIERRCGVDEISGKGVLDDVARKRMIDPGIWQSEDFGHLSTLAKLVFIGLFSQADDGRGRGKAQYIKNTLFPYDEETTSADIKRAFDEILTHVGTGFIDSAGTVYEGWMAAARIAGLIAGTPSSESVTHLGITGAVELSEPLTNFQYEQAAMAGMLTFSTSAANAVWVEQGINTLVLPGSNDDAGWKKIKRVKVRFELMQRLNDTVELLVGRINNDPDGRMTIIQAGNGVCIAMMAERKLLAGAHCAIDPDTPPQGDSAWFLVYADDIDALEKMYFTFRFRFAPDVT